MMRITASMKTFIRNLFVPNEANSGTPQILSGVGISAYLLIALVLIFAPQLAHVHELASLVEPFGFTSAQMVTLTNQARMAEGLPALTTNTKLAAAAEAKVTDMFAKQYFAHTSPEGLAPWDFFRSAGYGYKAAGENLASDFVRPEDAQAAFMASPSHRANIMSPLYTEVGIAVGQGLLGGHANIVIAEYFGTPKSAPVATTTASGTVPPKPTTTPIPPKPIATTTVAGTSTGTNVSTTVTSSIGIRTTPTGPEVLGTTAGASAAAAGSEQTVSRFTRTINNIESFMRRIPQYMKLRVIALFLTATLAIAMAFFIARAERLTPRILVRAFVVLIILGYAGTAGVKNWQVNHLTPTSFATISVVTIEQ
jgi:Cysteine-rich secretory protein family